MTQKRFVLCCKFTVAFIEQYIFPTTQTVVEPSAPAYRSTLLHELDDEARNRRFRTLFRLPVSEVVLESHEANFLYLSKCCLHKHSMSFCQLCPRKRAREREDTHFAQLYKLFRRQYAVLSFYYYFLCYFNEKNLSADFHVLLALPFSEITSVRKQTTGFFQSELQLGTRSGQEITFSGLKSRQPIYDVIMNRMRTVDYPSLSLADAHSGFPSSPAANRTAPSSLAASASPSAGTASPKPVESIASTDAASDSSSSVTAESIDTIQERGLDVNMANLIDG